MRDLTPLLAPRSVAVIGASTNPAKSGGILLKNLTDGGFGGPLYPINPRAEIVQERPAYRHIRDTPGPVDLAFIVLPRAAVKEAVQDCVAAGVRSTCIITAGFGETGDAGRREEESLGEVVRAGRLLTIGPNTIGLVAAEHRLWGSFVPFPSWRSGPIAVFAQTGIFAGAVMLQVMSHTPQRPGIGLSIDVGNKIDVDEMDFLEFAGADARTSVVGLNLEGIRDLPAFLESVAAVNRKKPVVMLKPGRSPQGARASRFHTGAIAIDEPMFDEGLRRHRLVRADDVEDFIGYLKAFAWLPLPRGPRIGVVTYSGALGVIATDELVGVGLQLAEFAPATLTRLASMLPEWQPPGNPSDLWISLEMHGNRSGHEVPFGAVLDDPETDMVLGILLAPPNADFADVREVFGGLRTRHADKPLVLVIYGGDVRDRWVRELEGIDIPIYSSTREAVRALRALEQYAGMRRERHD